MYFWDKHKTITSYYELLSGEVCDRYELTQMEYDIPVSYTHLTSGLSLETLVTMNPELIVYVTSDRNAKNDADAVNKLLSSDAVSDVEAIKNKKIVTIGYDEFMDYGPAVLDVYKRQ